jgi:alanyl-tRNA synthetase
MPILTSELSLQSSLFLPVSFYSTIVARITHYFIKSQTLAPSTFVQKSQILYNEKDMTASEIIEKYVAFFEKRGHKRIPNAPLIPENDPTTLFTSSGMQPLVPYLLGEPHPMGKRLVNVQNCFRAVDIDEVGDNRHTTFFRMLGNWSLGDYFKKEEIPWLWELLTKEFGLPKEKLFITIFKGNNSIPYDNESHDVWSEILEKEGLNPKEKIFTADSTKNWWSRSGTPEKMPAGELGGPDTEVYYEFEELKHDPKCQEDPIHCDCGKYMEIANSVFMQYQKQKDDSFKELPQKNVDYGGGVERLLAAVENKQDIHLTSLFEPIIKSIENITNTKYKDYAFQMRVIADHLSGAVFIIAGGIIPSNKEQGYILRRLIRRALDNFHKLKGADIAPVLEKIVEQYSTTDKYLTEKFETIKDVILEEEQKYKNTLANAKEFIHKKYSPRGEAGKFGDEIKGVTEISAEDAFILYSTHGLSPTQIKSLGYTFNDQEFAEKMKAHQALSKKGAEQKFKGGLADHSEKTIMGHTATHLLHKALRDTFGTALHQAGSNITPERVRFDFNFDRNLTPEELKKIEQTVNEKIKENLPVHFEMLTLIKAKATGAIGLFDEKYSDNVKVYFIGDYSKEICGGPHVSCTSKIKSFKIIKQENIGKGNRRIYATVG